MGMNGRTDGRTDGWTGWEIPSGRFFLYLSSGECVSQQLFFLFFYSNYHPLTYVHFIAVVLVLVLVFVAVVSLYLDLYLRMSCHVVLC